LNAFAAAPAFEEEARALYREVLWLIGDHLGTPRLIAERTGKAEGIKRRDFLPFGEELTVGGRSESPSYGQASPRQSFTGYEKDAETGLDYAQARYYAGGQGRFISVDPKLSSGRLELPESWNRYAYCANSPLVLTDASGLDWFVGSSGRNAIPVWRDAYSGGRNKWQNFVYYAKDIKQWVALNPFEREAHAYSSRAAALAAFNGYKKSAAINYIAGQISGQFFVAGKLISLSGIANENSEMFKAGESIGTKLGIAAGATGGATISGLLLDKIGKAGKVAEGVEMVYHGTTTSETVTSKGLNLADNLKAATMDVEGAAKVGLANEGFSVTTRLEDAEGFALGRSLIRDEPGVVLGASKADLEGILRKGKFDLNELRIMPEDFHKVGPGVFKRIN
jgi:RHS repeat-associated protein